ncbi:MAG TPA: membrane protein insertion efficiency factor YidD [Candidatus Binatia bacterium]|nr:membrane protein insertion efficiency factor YidD [Candidatus Binatia bacterium]
MRAVVGAIRAYQLVVSPLLGGQCRFFPSCSQFASDAVRQHGVVHGVALAMHRVGRCHPWQVGGYDPVPPRGV